MKSRAKLKGLNYLLYKIQRLKYYTPLHPSLFL